MPVYTVHAPVADAAVPPAQADRRITDRYVFIRDGFHFWAMIYGPFWLLVHRLWLAFIGYIVVVGALEVAMMLLRVGFGARLLVMALIAVLMGNEAANIKRWSYSRRRWREVGLVVADDIEMAERRFFEQRYQHNESQADAVATRRLPPSPPPGSTPPAPPSMRAGTAPSDVIGLFPQPGAIR